MGRTFLVVYVKSVYRQGDDFVMILSFVASVAAVATSTTRGLVGRSVSDVERDLIIDTLEHCLGNRTHAATILGISIRTLRNKLKEYTEAGIAVPAPQGAANAA